MVHQVDHLDHFPCSRNPHDGLFRILHHSCAQKSCHLYYQIISLASQSTVRASKSSAALIVASAGEHAGPFELFVISQAEGGYYLWNVGAGGYVYVPDPHVGAKVIISRNEDAKTIFEITKEDVKSYVIKIANKDLLWTVQPPVLPLGDILLEPANGSETQKFSLQYAPSA